MKEKLSIGITCYPTFGGSGVVATEIGKGMAERGHKVHFICSAIPRRLTSFTENIFFHEVEVSDYPLFTYTPYSLSLASKMVEVIQYQKLDLLHAHYAVPHATSAFLAREVSGERAPKVITTLHGTDITLVGNDRSYLPITRFSIYKSDGVTTPSEYLRRATYDKLNLSSQTDIEVIPNFVDTEFFSPADPDSMAPIKAIIGACPIATGTKILTHVSNFRPVKRLPDVVKIFAAVKEKQRAHLILIGDGPERSATERLVRELGLEESVCFLGKQESFVEILKRSDLFLLPSETESFGLAALEALSCGVPVVASNIHGIPEVVRNGETGVLADVGDVDAMAEGALKLLTDADLWSRYSKAARDAAVHYFNRDKIISQYESYYRRVLKGE